MIAAPMLALDLPLKLLIWQSADGWICVRSMRRAQKSRGYQATNGVAVPTVRTGRKFGYQ